MKKTYSEKDIIKLFKTGNFTIVYWDNACPTIYKGKWDIDKECDKDEYKEMNKHEIKFPMYDMNGYVPDIVDLLTKTLGGKIDTI